MKILLIFPRIEHGAVSYRDKGSQIAVIFGYPAITLPHIAAITPSKHTIQIIDENYDALNFDTDADLIGITSPTMTAPRAYYLADEFRKRGKKVVLGGWHASALPEEAKQHSDAVVIGEAEISWPILLDDFEKGKLKPFYKSTEEIDMSNIPPIRRDLLKHMPMVGAVQSTRGCPNRCEFCAITSFYNHGVKQRPVKNVIEEIKQMPNRLFLMHDPSITTNTNYSREIFKAIIHEKIKKGWLANGNANVLGKIDDDFLQLARKAGLIEWFIGFESVSQEALNGIKKTVNKVEDFKRVIKRLHDYGMAIQGGIIFGFDQDTPDIFDNTLEKLYEWELDVLEVNILTPFPGTPLFDRLDREGRILTRDWSRYNQVDVVFKPKNMSEKELWEGARKVAKEYYTIPRVIQRFTRTMLTSKRLYGVLPAATNLSFRRYYKRDFAF